MKLVEVYLKNCHGFPVDYLVIWNKKDQYGAGFTTANMKL